MKAKIATVSRRKGYHFTDKKRYITEEKSAVNSFGRDNKNRMERICKLRK